MSVDTKCQLSIVDMLLNDSGALDDFEKSPAAVDVESVCSLFIIVLLTFIYGWCMINPIKLPSWYLSWFIVCTEIELGLGK